MVVVVEVVSNDDIFHFVEKLVQSYFVNLINISEITVITCVTLKYFNYILCD